VEIENIPGKGRLRELDQSVTRVFLLTAIPTSKDALCESDRIGHLSCHIRTTYELRKICLYYLFLRRINIYGTSSLFNQN
jgi:hypothetical protein